MAIELDSSSEVSHWFDQCDSKSFAADGGQQVNVQKSKQNEARATCFKIGRREHKNGTRLGAIQAVGFLL